MKEFEKWFKKHKPYEIYSCMNMAEKAWKAALEWVLSKQYKPYGDRYLEPVINIDDIKEELND